MKGKADAVATAERSLMYQLRFNFVLPLPYEVLNRVAEAGVWRPADMPMTLKHAIYQSSWYLLHDR